MVSSRGASVALGQEVETENAHEVESDNVHEVETENAGPWPPMLSGSRISNREPRTANLDVGGGVRAFSRVARSARTAGAEGGGDCRCGSRSRCRDVDFVGAAVYKESAWTATNSRSDPF